MFDTIMKKTHEQVDRDIQRLSDFCDQYPDVKEFVSYLIEYSDRMAYCSNRTTNTDIGRELIQFIWQITNIDLSNMANTHGFSPSWAAELNGFIANYFLDDFAFDFIQVRQGVFEFKCANYIDGSRWLQDPRIMIEAAKANREYYDVIYQDRRKMFDRTFRVDDVSVFEILEAK